MSILERFTKSDMDRGVEAFKSTPGALLIDVREADEYRGGHVPGSVNIPAGEISRVSEYAPDQAAPIFVYCLSGVRSAKAAAALKQLGYSNVTSIGGIRSYHGELEK